MPSDIAFAFAIGAIIALLAILTGFCFCLIMLFDRVNEINKRMLDIEGKTEKRDERRAILTSSEMILGGRAMEEYRATSADE